MRNSVLKVDLFKLHTNELRVLKKRRHLTFYVSMNKQILNVMKYCYIQAETYFILHVYYSV